MVKSTFIYCKTCAKKTKHWDNTGTEKEQALGKFVCSICKTAYTPKPKTNAYPKPISQAPESNYYKKDYGESVPKSMFGAWANNLIISFIDKGVIKTLDEAISKYNETITKYDSILNNKGTAIKEQPQLIEDASKNIDEVNEILDPSDELDLSNFDL